MIFAEQPRTFKTGLQSGDSDSCDRCYQFFCERDQLRTTYKRVRQGVQQRYRGQVGGDACASR